MQIVNLRFDREAVLLIKSAALRRLPDYSVDLPDAAF